MTDDLLPMANSLSNMESCSQQEEVQSNQMQGQCKMKTLRIVDHRLTHLAVLPSVWIFGLTYSYCINLEAP